MARADVLLVSLGSTAGLRAADAELRAALERAGARVAVAAAAPQRDVRTFALTDLVWARAARAAARAALDEHGGPAVAGAGRDPLRRARGGQPARPPRGLAAPARTAAPARRAAPPPV